MLRMDAFCGVVGLLVPPLGHEQVMKELHDTHPGIILMKAQWPVVWFRGQTLMLILKEG